MTEERRQPDAVISYMWFFADDNDFVLFLGVEFDEFLAAVMVSASSSLLSVEIMKCGL